MASRRKIAIWLGAIAVCLLAGVVFLAPIFLNLDHYRPEVISYFEQNTGKKVEIGRLSLTFFPQITVHMDGFGVKSPPLFPPSYIVKVARTDGELDLVEKRPRSYFHIASGETLRGNRDYLLEAFADSLCGAFFCNTRTRCCPDAGIEALPPSTISLAVILRP